MGKIVRSARFIGDPYVVEVPHAVVRELPVSDRVERDERFAASFEEPPASSPSVESDVSEREPAQRVDWEQLRADAEAIIDQAVSDAESMIRQTESTALELVASAQAHVEQIEAQAREDGREAGYAAGKTAAEEEQAPVVATMRELIESIRTQRAALMNAAEPELVRLAMAIAERVVHGELASNPNVVVENVRQALTRLVTREVVTLRVNPADLDAIRQHRDALVASSDIEHLRILEDQRVDRGGVMIETDAGTIDSKIATQLREARRAILSEDGIALGDEEMLRSSAQAS
jgi:flagellar assembly protein FliH